MYPHVTDEYDDAMKDEPRKFFGLCSTSARKVVLVKGQGKVDYDPQIHNGQKTSLAVNVTVTPCDPTAKLITRDVLNWTPEFTQAIRPSLEKMTAAIKAVKSLTAKEINPLREVNGLWVCGEFVPRPGNKAGETWTTLKLTDVYKDEAACVAAWQAREKANGGSASSDMPITQDVTPQAATQNGNGNDPNKAALLTAFPVIWTANGGDVEKFKAAIASVFAPDAPEVIAFIASQMQPQGA